MKKTLFFFLFFILLHCSKNSAESSNSSENSTYTKATNFRNSGEKDSAYIYYALAKKEFLKNNDSLFVAKCLVNMAIIQTDKGDFFGGIETSLEAENFLKRKDSLTHQVKSSNYNNVALANAELQDYNNAEKFYFLALNSTLDKSSKTIYYNNIANNYLDQKEFSQAKVFLQKALKTNDSIAYARALNNWGRCLFKENNNRDVLPILQKALDIRTRANDIWGQNSSYATLSDYYQFSSIEKSRFYAEKMIKTATEIKSPDDKLEALEKLIALENTENSKKYFSEYKKINDSLQNARAKAKNQFALIRYETEKEKTENIKKQNHILKQNFAIALLGATVFIGFFWFQKRKKRLEQEKEIEIKNTQIKYSKKVHDVVANGLYQTIVEVENQPELDRNILLNKLEKMYEESRDIAHEDSTKNMEREFSVRLFEMISSYSSEKQKALVIGNEPYLWQNVSQEVKSEIFYVIRELMINMKKHSNATIVSVKFENVDNKLKINYNDNGQGINNLQKTKNSGIKNTENRIEQIDGDINFENNPNGGLLIKITIPIH